jgi:hypothetical protein
LETVRTVAPVSPAPVMHSAVAPERELARTGA